MKLANRLRYLTLLQQETLEELEQLPPQMEPRHQQWKTAELEPVGYSQEPVKLPVRLTPGSPLDQVSRPEPEPQPDPLQEIAQRVGLQLPTS